MRRGATRRAPSSRPATISASGSPNKSAARAEASTTLTAVAVIADQAGGFSRRAQPKPADFRQHLGRRRRSFLLSGGLDDRQEFALQRPMMTFCPLPKALYEVIWRVLD